MIALGPLMTSIIRRLLLYTMLIIMGNGRSKSIYTRTLTNVGQSFVTHKAIVTGPNGSQVVVSPDVLVFMNKYEKKSNNLTIKFKGNMERRFSFGSLVWVEENGKHTVRSPIVVTPSVLSTI